MLHKDARNSLHNDYIIFRIQFNLIAVNQAEWELREAHDNELLELEAQTQRHIVVACVRSSKRAHVECWTLVDKHRVEVAISHLRTCGGTIRTKGHLVNRA